MMNRTHRTGQCVPDMAVGHNIHAIRHRLATPAAAPLERKQDLSHPRKHPQRGSYGYSGSPDIPV